MRDQDSQLESWRSNDLLPDETQNRIRARLSDVQKEVNQLDLEIEKLRETSHPPSNNLLASLTKKTEEMMILRGAISPLKKIPREILSEFFFYCDDTRSPVKIPPRRSEFRSFPWSLAQVCSHWRNVLWGIPGVWENIRICDGITDSEIPTAISLVCGIFSHIPFLVSLVLPHNDQLFANLVIPFASRLKRLEAFISKDSFHTFFGLPAGSVDSLTSINLHFLTNAHIFSALENNPLHTSRGLRRVVFTANGSWMGWPQHLLLLPWAQLTEISLPNTLIPIRSIHSILQQCTCLISCTLVVGHETLSVLTAAGDWKDITLSNLQSFVLHRFGPHPDWETFFQPLILPSFKHLTIPDAQSWDQDVLKSLINRSACPLESLYLGCYRNTPPGFHSLLKMLPTLHNLYLPWQKIPASVFRAIFRGKILPAVERMQCIIDPTALNALLDLLERQLSEQPSGQRPIVGLHEGVFTCVKDPLDEHTLDDAQKRYNALRHRFQENGRDIKVFIAS